MAEEMFQDHLATLVQNHAEGKQQENVKIGTTLPKDKVGIFGHLTEQKKKSTKDYFLGCVFPGECYELKKDIHNICFFLAIK